MGKRNCHGHSSTRLCNLERATKITTYSREAGGTEASLSTSLTPRPERCCMMTGKGSLEAEAVSIIRLLITAEMMQWLTSHKLCKHRVVMKETNMALMALALFMEGY